MYAHHLRQSESGITMLLNALQSKAKENLNFQVVDEMNYVEKPKRSSKHRFIKMCLQRNLENKQFYKSEERIGIKTT